MLSNINIEVDKGELFSLLGPSGSGKTTLLLSILGAVAPREGSIEIAGEDITATPMNRRNLGVVFQDYALFSNMTVVENIIFPLVLRKTAKNEIDRRLTETLQRLEIEAELGGRLPAQLSGGQQQRVALARALIFGPELVLMDEPLRSLDEELRLKVRYQIREVQEQTGVTMLYVTHDQREAMEISDRIGVLGGDGRIKQISSPERLYRCPASETLAMFIGFTNRFPAELVNVDGRECTVRIRGRDETTPVIAAWGPQDGRPGEEVNRRGVLLTRPEHIKKDCKEGGVSCKIQSCAFSGSHWVAKGQILGAHEFTASFANHRTREEISRIDSIKIDQSALFFPSPDV